jgi:hypothetical protein
MTYQTANRRAIFGKDLCAEDRQLALDMFNNRYTGDYSPPWIKIPLLSMYEWPLQHYNDASWLAVTKFYVNRNSRLDFRFGQCIENPQFPFHRLLYFCPVCVWAALAVNLRYKGWESSYHMWKANFPHVKFDMPALDWEIEVKRGMQRKGWEPPFGEREEWTAEAAAGYLAIEKELAQAILANRLEAWRAGGA